MTIFLTIPQRMAKSSFQLFLSQVSTAIEPLKVRVLEIIFDILMVHERFFLKDAPENGEKIVQFLIEVLGNEESDRVQSLAAVGIAKLMLAGMVPDERVLHMLMLVYLSPETADNQQLRQCLSYFFPVYSYSISENQTRMRKVCLPSSGPSICSLIGCVLHRSSSRLSTRWSTRIVTGMAKGRW